MSIKVGLKHIEIWNDSMEKVVCKYEEEPIHKGEIVFYGPSYFTRWSEKYGNKPLREVILGESGKQCVINRGFGSSCPEHQLYYYPRMVRPLEPKVLVYGSWGNGSAFGYSDEESWELAQRVIGYTLTDFPDAHIYLCSAFRTKGMSEEDIASRIKYSDVVKQFAEETPRCHYLDVFNYEPLTHEDIYIEDGVHFNAKGYQAMACFFKEALKGELEQF